MNVFIFQGIDCGYCARDGRRVTYHRYCLRDMAHLATAGGGGGVANCPRCKKKLEVPGTAGFHAATQRKRKGQE